MARTGDAQNNESGPLFRAAVPLDRSLDIDLTLRNAITAAIKHSSKSRAQIADDVSRLTGLKVTEKMLYSFTSESKAGHRFPAAWLPALVWSTGDPRILHAIADAAGYHLVTNEEAMLIELARAYLSRKDALEKMETIEQRLMRRNGRE